MAIKYRSDEIRTLTLGLIGLVVVSWVITFLLFIYRSQDQGDHQRQVRAVQASETELRAQLAQQSSTAGGPSQSGAGTSSGAAGARAAKPLGGPAGSRGCDQERRDTSAAPDRAAG